MSSNNSASQQQQQQDQPPHAPTAAATATTTTTRTTNTATTTTTSTTTHPPQYQRQQQQQQHQQNSTTVHQQYPRQPQPQPQPQQHQGVGVVGQQQPLSITSVVSGFWHHNQSTPGSAKAVPGTVTSHSTNTTTPRNPPVSTAKLSLSITPPLPNAEQPPPLIPDSGPTSHLGGGTKTTVLAPGTIKGTTPTAAPATVAQHTALPSRTPPSSTPGTHLTPTSPSTSSMSSASASASTGTSASSSTSSSSPRQHSPTLRALSSSPPISTKPASSGRTLNPKKFQGLLADPLLDMASLRSACWRGVPPEFRHTIWKMLLGYLPIKLDRRTDTLRRKRKEYHESLRPYYTEEHNTQDQSVIQQIRIDLKRMYPHIPLYHNDTVFTILEAILYVWANRHPASGYVQGIHDLSSPIIVVMLSEYTAVDLSHLERTNLESLSTQNWLDIEADSYWCLSNLLDGIQQNYTFSQIAIQKSIFNLQQLIFKIDEPLAKHLDAQGVSYIHFAFRWFNCLLLRELPLHVVARVWDTYMSEDDCSGFAVLHVYMCAAFLKFWSSQLRKMDFGELLIFLQNPPTADWDESSVEILLSEAFMFQSLYHNSPKHLETH